MRISWAREGLDPPLLSFLLKLYILCALLLHFVSFRGGEADEESVSQNVAILPEVFPKPMDFREADCHALRARNDRKIFLLIASSDRKVKFSIAFQGNRLFII